MGGLQWAGLHYGDPQETFRVCFSQCSFVLSYIYESLGKIYEPVQQLKKNNFILQLDFFRSLRYFGKAFLVLTISICCVEFSATEGVVLDLAPLSGCLRPTQCFRASPGSGASIPLSRESTFIRKVVVAGNGTAVTPAVNSEHKSWFCYGLELRSGASLCSSRITSRSSASADFILLAHAMPIPSQAG